ncbi:Mitochondrial PGP phosphatase [Rhizoctonia solani]|uniref:Mitochondrial PGP phosphatase n=1 Tax=Rhizoctonia solani TaxID=456999 RepID=A0A8H7I7I3_9AGAM|nr:Mitochondrial PGP phosphatase [Rhizoctonia solani]
MSNLHGSIFALRALLKPGLLLPGIKVETISRLNFSALKQAGYTGVVFDRDNCLVCATQSSQYPAAYASVDRRLGSMQSIVWRENMLIVSNSAGTSDDPLGIQTEETRMWRRDYSILSAEASDKHLQGPDTVPSPTEGKIIHAPNLNTPLDLDNQANPTLPELETQVAVQPTTTEGPRLLIIGDRLLTDILLSNALSSSNHHLPIWTTRLWKTPDLPILRFAEKSVLRMLLWNRNQTFRNGVVEQRAKGETWLGKEGGCGGYDDGY